MYSPRGTSGSNRKLLCSDDSGRIRLYNAKNGTLARSLDLEGSQTSNNIAKSGASAAVGVGPDVVFLSASKADKIISR